MRNLDLLVPQERKEKNWWTWATVTWSDPLRIRLDGESDALDATPDNLTGTARLEPGTRVWVQVSGHRVIVTGTPNSPIPAGMLAPFAGNDFTIPHGWLLCDGREVSRTDYASLFGICGVNFGEGDGVNTFNLPDLRERFPLGASDNIWLTLSGGSNKIDVLNLPPHSHAAGGLSTSSAGAHSHNLGLSSTNHSSGQTIRRGGPMGNVALWGNNGVESNGAHSHSITGSTANTGSGWDYWQPFLALNFIIKH